MAIHLAAGQELRWFAPLAPAGQPVLRAQAAGIEDKGSGVLITIETSDADETPGKAVFHATTRLFIRGTLTFGEPSFGAPASGAHASGAAVAP